MKTLSQHFGTLTQRQHESRSPKFTMGSFDWLMRPALLDEHGTVVVLKQVVAFKGEEAQHQDPPS
jgi:hypothetical protein